MSFVTQWKDALLAPVKRLTTREMITETSNCHVHGGFIPCRRAKPNTSADQNPRNPSYSESRERSRTEENIARKNKQQNGHHFCTKVMPLDGLLQFKITTFRSALYVIVISFLRFCGPRKE